MTSVQQVIRGHPISNQTTTRPTPDTSARPATPVDPNTNPPDSIPRRLGQPWGGARPAVS